MLILDVFKTHADVQEAYLRMSVLVETVFTLVNFSPDQPDPWEQDLAIFTYPL